MKDLIRQILHEVMTEQYEQGHRIEPGDLTSLPPDTPVTVGIALAQKKRGSLGRSSPQWRYIKTTARKAPAIMGAARQKGGFYDASISYGH